jgi:hypothetical protein
MKVFNLITYLTFRVGRTKAERENGGPFGGLSIGSSLSFAIGQNPALAAAVFGANSTEAAQAAAGLIPTGLGGANSGSGSGGFLQIGTTTGKGYAYYLMKKLIFSDR